MTITEQVASLRLTATRVRAGVVAIYVPEEIAQAADTIERQAAEIETHLKTIHDMLARGTRRILEQGR